MKKELAALALSDSKLGTGHHFCRDFIDETLGILSSDKVAITGGVKGRNVIC